MATYIPNVTDVFPEIQPFKPDYSFLQSALSTKQAQYNAAFEQLNSVYGSILNAPLTRDINQERRAEFLKAADNNIKKITSLDLSLPQNVQTASNVFKPFYDDKNLVWDMTWTKQFNKELGRAEALSKCTTDDCAGQYWEGGVRLMNYLRDDFKNANDDSAFQMGTVKYTPAYNIVDKAVKLAKEQGFNVKYDTIQNGYIVTTKNGQALEAPLSVYFSEIFANDPRAKSYMTAQAQLNRYDTVESLAPQFNNDKAAAEAYYIKENLASTIEVRNIQRDKIQDSLSSLEASKLTLERIGSRRRLLPSEQEKYDNVLKQYALTEAALDRVNKEIEVIESSYDPNNLSVGRRLVDNANANNLLTESLQNAVKVAAYRDTEVSLKADPYALARYKSALTEAREKAKEKREAEKEAELLGLFDQFSTKTSKASYAEVEDLFADQQTTAANVTGEYASSVNSILRTLLSGPQKNAALALLKKYNISEKELASGAPIDVEVYGKILKDVKDNILKNDPVTFNQVVPLLQKAQKGADAYNFISSKMGENNRLIANVLKADEYKDKRGVVDLLIDPTTNRLRTKEEFVKAGLSQYPSQGVEAGFFDWITGTGRDELLGDAYDELMENFSETYNNQRDNLQSVGLAVTGGAGGVGVANTLVAVADPYKFMSPNTSAVKSLLSSLDDDGVVIGEAAGGDARTILNNLNIDLNTYYKEPTQDRPVVTVEYTPFSEGTSNKHQAKILINADYVSRLVNQKLISKDDAAKLIEEGISISIDPSKTNNSLTRGATTDYRDIILNNTGSYTIENPGGSITINKQPDGSTSLNGYLNVWENGDFVQEPYNKYYINQAGGPGLYDNTEKFLYEQAIINAGILSNLPK